MCNYIYRGNCKTLFGPDFALLASDSDFSQVAYVQQDMSTCEKPNLCKNHQNRSPKLSFAITSILHSLKKTR